MTDETRKQLVMELTAAEGCIRHMYLDGAGIVTCGVGHVLAGSLEAQHLRWFDWQTYKDASAEQIGEEYERIAKAEWGRAATYYQTLSKLRIVAGVAESLLARDIEQTCGLLAGVVPLESLPSDAQIAVVDMAFNLGVSGLKHKFPKFVDAVVARDWATCANECHRLDVAASRNLATIRRFTELSKKAA